MAQFREYVKKGETVPSAIYMGVPATVEKISEEIFTTKKATGNGTEFHRATVSYETPAGDKRTATAMLYKNFQDKVLYEPGDNTTMWIVMHPAQYVGLTTISGGGRLNLEELDAQNQFQQYLLDKGINLDQQAEQINADFGVKEEA